MCETCSTILPVCTPAQVLEVGGIPEGAEADKKRNRCNRMTVVLRTALNFVQ